MILELAHYPCRVWEGKLAIYKFCYRNHGISPLHQLLLTLRFYAVGTMLVSVADFIGVSKTSACRIVRDVSCTISSLYDKYVYMHANTENEFYNIARFPHVLGVIDCTHVKVQSCKLKSLIHTYSSHPCFFMSVICRVESYHCR